MVSSRWWLAAAFVVGGSVAAPPSAAPGALPSKQPPTIPVIEGNLANALSKSETTRILRVHKLRTNTPPYVTAVEWVDLANGQSRMRWYNASGRLWRDTARRYTGKMVCREAGGASDCTLPASLSGACGCDLDPFTNFPTLQKLQVSLLGRETIGGKPTFHLRFTEIGGPWALTTTDVWIDRTTYLPVHQRVVFPKTQANPRPYMVTNDFTWLPRTSANLARPASG